MTHTPLPEEHHGRRRRGSMRAGLGVVAFVIGTAVLSYLILRSAPPDLLGSWVGRDGAGVEVVYHFDQGGSGYRVMGGRRETFRYLFTPGYPNSLSITLEADSVTFSGIAEVGSRLLRIELGDPGGPAPGRLSERALELRRPPVR